MKLTRAVVMVALTLSLPASAATFTVTNTQDSGAGSLRQAILNANATPGADTIAFAIGSGTQLILVTSPLPAITDPVTIDGTTQPGYAGKPLIDVDGSLFVNFAPGFDLASGGPSVVLSLSITNFHSSAATTFQGSAGVRINTPGSLVKNCYIGVALDGDTAGGNDHGVDLYSSGGIVESNVIADGYVGVYSSSGGNTIYGNIVGMNAATTAELGNVYGLAIFANNDVIRNNVVAGNPYGNMLLSGSNLDVRGNKIGVTPSGRVIPIGYGASVAIYASFFSAGNVRFGGGNPGDGNEVAGGEPAVYLSSATTAQIIGNYLHDNDGGIQLYQTSQSLIMLNRISGNFGTAIWIGSGSGNLITSNSIDQNYDGIRLSNSGRFLANDTLDLDVGGNLGQNYPVLTSVTSIGGTTTINGTLNSAPSQGFHLEFFNTPSCNSSGHGEGKTLIGGMDVNTDSAGNATFSLPLAFPVASGSVVTATATDGNQNTSEFSACAVVQGAGNFSFDRSNYSVGEGGGSISILVRRTGGSAGTAAVSYTTTSGTATAGSDFTPATATLSFGPGETEKSFSIPILQDSIVEAEESFSIALSNPSNGSLLSVPATATVAIVDDEPRPVITIADASVVEGNSGTTNMQFVLTRPAVGITSGVELYTASNTAFAGEDFQSVSSAVIFGPGETQKTMMVPIYGDTTFEQDETFMVYFSSVSNATVARSFATGTILNDDARPTITVSDARVVEGDTGLTSAVITLTANQRITGQISYVTVDGNAQAGSDYVPVSSYVYFSNETTKTFSVQVKGDMSAESDENFAVRFYFNGTVAQLDHNPALVTIVNDDAGFGPPAQSAAVGKKASFTLNLGVAPSAPVTISLSTNNDGVLDVPATLVVDSASTLIELAAKKAGAATLTVTLPAPYSRTFTADVSVYQPADLVIEPSAISVPAGTSITVSASFQPPLSTASAVALKTLDASTIEIPSSIEIPPGKPATFTLKALKRGSTAFIARLGPDHGERESAYLVDVVEAPKTPLITQITPATGAVSGGTSVTINGANLAASCTLYFGGVPAVDVAFGSAASMTATTPAHASGTVDVLLACGGDSFILANGFTYLATAPTVASTQPTFGAIKGGTLVRIGGGGFRSGCWPFFDGAAARSADFISSAEIVAEAPPHAAGRVAVSVRCSGADEGALADGFTYSGNDEPSPQIGSVTPLAGAPGQPVTLSGVRFRRDDTVTLGDAVATILSSSPDSDLLRVPELPAGEVAITLTDAMGHVTTTGPVFTVLEPPPPHIDALAPKSVRPGTDVVLDGTGFRPGYAFAFGTTRASLVSLSYTRVLLRAPDVAPGAYPLNVYNAAGKLASIGPSVSVAATGPSISSITPACASSDGGGSMTIRGAGFAAGATVTFDGTIAAATVVDANTITVTVPAGAVGSPRIVITNPNGASAALGGAFVYFSPFDPNGGCSGGRSRPLRH